MKAGFAKADITPPAGTRMIGFGGRDKERGCDGVHDNIYVRALYLAHGGEEALVLAYDLCFLDREDTDRVKGAIGREIDLSPSRILLNSSHSHVGPATGTWGYQGYEAQDRLYFGELAAATVSAAVEARRSARDVTVWAGSATSSLPLSRRAPDGKGGVTWAPSEDAPTCDRLPICLLKDSGGRPVCLLFSVSCHPSTIHGWLISAEYPGVAADRLDEYMGATAAMFLQGCGGDAKPSVIGRGRDTWGAGTWEEVAEAGEIVAGEVIGGIEAGLQEVAPQLRAEMMEMHWPLQAVPGRKHYEAVAAAPETGELRRLWAERQVELLDRGRQLPASAPITLHGLQLGEGLRMVGIEGEAVAELGLLVLDAFSDGVTFPLGYTNGAQLYLTTSAMLDEGGYEADSYYEYGFPAPLAKGMEDILRDSIAELRRRGIE